MKLTLFAALGYFVMPFDVLPDLLPVIGFTDDAAVIATAIASVANAIRPDHREKAREALPERPRRAGAAAPGYPPPASKAVEHASAGELMAALQDEPVAAMTA